MSRFLALVLALCVGMASAFTSSPRVEAPARATRATALHMSFENELGAQRPLGFFDPLGLLDGASQERFDRLRTVELKHGRISMLAVTGHLFTSGGIRWGGDAGLDGTKFTDIPSGLAAFSELPAGYVFWFVALCGILETRVMKDVTGEAEFPGDYRNGYGPSVQLWDNFTPEEQLKKRAVELNNGRAAMMGILALMVHEQLNNDPYVINSLLGFPVDFNAGF